MIFRIERSQLKNYCGRPSESYDAPKRDCFDIIGSHIDKAIITIGKGNTPILSTWAWEGHPEQ